MDNTNVIVSVAFGSLFLLLAFFWVRSVAQERQFYREWNAADADGKQMLYLDKRRPSDWWKVHELSEEFYEAVQQEQDAADCVRLGVTQGQLGRARLVERAAAHKVKVRKEDTEQDLADKFMLLKQREETARISRLAKDLPR